MWNQEVEERWQRISLEVMLEIKEWRLQHPKVTFKEIEEAVDRCWGRARARLLQDVVMSSEAAEVSGGPKNEGPQCSQCGHLIESRGQRIRSLTTSYNQSISLKRSYRACPTCGTGLFPPG